MMKILVNRKIRLLFGCLLLLTAAFTLLSVFCVIRKGNQAALCAALSTAGLGIAAAGAVFWYLKEQGRQIEEAAEQIREYSAGNRNARIDCDEEGDLYRLFQEVNALVSILNAHADNEKRAKTFMKDTISDISHQLKTPLAALNIYQGIIQEEAKESPVILEFSELCEQELDRTETLVQNLLKITKLDAGTIVIENAQVNVSQMMEQVQKSFAYRAEKQGKTLLLLGDPEAELLCDQTWMREAVSNLVKNALDHTKKGDTISIRWKKFPSMVQIAVEDNGSGIHPEDLPHIFKRFYRSRFSKDTQGIGLGLSLAKAIVEAQGGSIESDSVLGVGTTFTMDFLIPTKL